MPVYTYRRADGTTFDLRQKFSDDPLKVDPVTGQSVVRVVQPTSVIFKGSGFYVNDSKSGSRSHVNNSAGHNGSGEKSDNGDNGNKADKPDKTDKAEKAETKASNEKAEKAEKSESKPSGETSAAPKPAAKPVTSAAAD